MVQIDIDADLMLVDDDDRYIGHLPADESRLRVGDVVVAGRAGACTWVLIDEITGTAVYFRAIDPEGARRRGLPSLEGGAFLADEGGPPAEGVAEWREEIGSRVDDVLAGRVELVDADETYRMLSAELASKRAMRP